MTPPRGGRPFPRLRQFSHHVTWFLGTRFPRAIPLVFVVGYPKSGTTWACDVVAEMLGLPWPRFSLLPIGCAAVVHGHERVWKRYPRGVYVMRDGRDVMVSQYFFVTRRVAGGDNPPMNARERRALPGMVNKARVRENLPDFIGQMMTRPASSRANWGEHVRSYYEVHNPNVALLRYEHLLHDGENELAGAIETLTGERPDRERVAAALAKFSFRKRSGRKSGQEDRTSFLRKGMAGDWVNHFSREAAEIFDRYAGEMLVRAGYEPDRGWVERCPPLAEMEPEPSAVLT